MEHVAIGRTGETALSSRFLLLTSYWVVSDWRWYDYLPYLIRRQSVEWSRSTDDLIVKYTNNI